MLFGITRNRLLSKGVFNILTWAAFSAILLTALFLFFNIADEDLRVNIVDRVNESVVLSSIVGLLITPVIFATGYLYVAMWIYLAVIDDSSPEDKIIWFILMVFGIWLGAIIYYFVVYRRQVLMKLGDSGNAIQS